MVYLLDTVTKTSLQFQYSCLRVYLGTFSDGSYVPFRNGIEVRTHSLAGAYAHFFPPCGYQRRQNVAYDACDVYFYDVHCQVRHETA